MFRTLTLLALAAAGCTSPNDPMQPYLGTWTFASGTDNVSCPNGMTAAKLTGNVTIKPSTDGGLLVLDPEGCNFTYALDNAAARAAARTCSFPVPELGQGVTAEVTYDAITLTTSDGKSMNDVFSGSVVYQAPTGNLNCVFSGTGTLNKISDD